ncbi:hypothetical protein UFOVP1311_2 [uncultured Caudovirales phage]|jgi:hypothetical protein|uniref:Uncharacterized protein n=1 Tax=uncultured Caudovirales phage TaxID=2100421 RepID=A0A6J5RYF7_9CAUD|nr:hypothetical protein UFOVP1311_2 [uncultured Caudovirales phage]
MLGKRKWTENTTKRPSSSCKTSQVKEPEVKSKQVDLSKTLKSSKK